MCKVSVNVIYGPLSTQRRDLCSGEDDVNVSHSASAGFESHCLGAGAGRGGGGGGAGAGGDGGADLDGLHGPLQMQLGWLGCFCPPALQWWSTGRCRAICPRGGPQLPDVMA